jgi:3-hydroxyacyl-[acyl-carrier-protein] dehydratase
MSGAFFQTRFLIDANHPALPGHFPGRPVVPGVVLLDQVATALAQWKSTQLGELPHVKFLRPLLPGEEATLRFEETGNGIRFHISHADETVATGQVSVTPDANR